MYADGLFMGEGIDFYEGIEVGGEYFMDGLSICIMLEKWGEKVIGIWYLIWYLIWVNLFAICELNIRDQVDSNNTSGHSLLLILIHYVSTKWDNT